MSENNEELIPLIEDLSAGAASVAGVHFISENKVDLPREYHCKDCIYNGRDCNMFMLHGCRGGMRGFWVQVVKKGDTSFDDAFASLGKDLYKEAKETVQLYESVMQVNKIFDLSYHKAKDILTKATKLGILN